MKKQSKTLPIVLGILGSIAVALISIFIVKPNRTLEVLVRDKQQKNPVSDAIVTLDNDRHLTKNDGLVYFESLKKGRKNYKVTKENYDDFEGTVVITGKSNSLIVDLELLRDTVNPVGYIDTPPDGSTESTPVSLTGRAYNIRSSHLWIVVKPHEASGWWPQGSEIITRPNGSWSSSAHLGGPSGERFDIHLILADENANASFNDYLARGTATGDYPGEPLPSGAKSLIYITVQKR